MLNKPPDTQWTDVDVLNNCLFTYNFKMVSRVTGYTPNEAKQDKNQTNVKINLETKAKHNRIYPDIVVGSNVKVYRKKANFDKEHVSVWSDLTYKVDRIEEVNHQKFYHVAGRARPLLRNEVLLIT